MLDLNKNESISLDLKKEKIDMINVGLGWDTVADLDVHAILRSGAGDKLSTVYYGRLSDNGVSLSGDNLTGAGDGDDEIIYINKNRLSSNVKVISIYVNVYSSSKNFSDIKGAFIRLYDKDKVYAKSSISKGDKTHRAIHFADIYVDKDEITFKVIMEYGNTISSLVDSYSTKAASLNEEKHVCNSAELNGKINEKPDKKKGLFKKLFGI